MSFEFKWREFEVITSVYYQDDSYYGPSIEKESIWLWEHVESGIIVTDKEKFDDWLKGVLV